MAPSAAPATTGEPEPTPSWPSALLAVPLALPLALAPDLAGTGPAAAAHLLGAAGLVALPLVAITQAVTRLGASVPALRRLAPACAAIASVPLPALALARLVPAWPDLLPWAPPAVMVLSAAVAVACALGLPRLARRTGAGFTLALPLVLGSLVMLAVWVHVRESTFLAIRPGRAALHLRLFLATWATTVVLAPVWSLALCDRLERRRGCVPLAAPVLASGAATVVLTWLDRRFFVDLYPAVHLWLKVLAIVSAVAAARMALVATGIDRRRHGRLGGAAALVLVAAAAACVARASGLGPEARSQLARSTLGRASLDALAARLPSRGPATAGHPLLRFERHERGRPPRAGWNVLLVTVDALRWDFGAADALPAVAPNAARLAAGSVRFERAYAQGSRTAIGMGSLMLGKYSAHLDWRLLLYQGGRIRDPARLPAAEREALGGKFVYTTLPEAAPGAFLAERAHARGVRTMAVAYAGDNEFFRRGGGFDRGFDAFEDLGAAGWRPPTSSRVAELAIRQRQGSGPGPWFQWVHLYDPHESGGDPARYRELVAAFDEGLGMLLDELDRRGDADRTVVILTADHGEALGEHRHRGHATSLYEEQVRVPLLVRVPGAGGRAEPRPVALVDLAPTILAAFGGPSHDLDGVNLWPLLLRGEYPDRRPIFLELHRYLSNRGERTRDLKAVVLDGHKLVRDRRTGAEQLFDLARDPGESRNRIGSDPATASLLRDVLDGFLAEAEKVHPLP